MPFLELRPPDLENLHAEVACIVCQGTGRARTPDDEGADTTCGTCAGAGVVTVGDDHYGRGHLSHSSIGTQLACLRRYGYRYEQKLELVERPEYLSMGSAFHKAIELGDPEAGADLMRRPAYDEAEQERLEINMAIVECAARLYLERWGSPDTAEFKYRVRLRNPATGHYSRTFDLVGAADGVTNHGGYLELTEAKLVGRVDAVTVQTVKLDRQLGLAAYALWRVTGKPTRFIRKRFVKKPSIKRKQKETHGEFLLRLRLDYEERPEFYALEEPANRDADDLLILEAELWDWAEQRRDAGHRGFYARNTSACHDYGGCAFIPLCTGDPDAPALYRRMPDRILEGLEPGR